MTENSNYVQLKDLALCRWNNTVCWLCV